MLVKRSRNRKGSPITEKARRPPIKGAVRQRPKLHEATLAKWTEGPRNGDPGVGGADCGYVEFTDNHGRRVRVWRGRAITFSWRTLIDVMDGDYVVARKVRRLRDVCQCPRSVGAGSDARRHG